MVDDPAHLALVEACADTVDGVRVAIDIDAGLRLGRSHVGPKRSPLHDTSEVVRVRPGRASIAGSRSSG